MTDIFDLVVIGHISFDENIINNEKHVIKSGSAYLSALPASLFSKKIGVVSRVGEDYPFDELKNLKIDVSGVKRIEGGKTTRFYHTYLSEDGSERTFRAELNVGADIVPTDIPDAYLNSKYIHVATNLPNKQIEFIKYIRQRSDAVISIDTLEQYIQNYKPQVIAAFNLADIIFVDKKEHDLIQALKFKRMVIKKGKKGAEYVFGSSAIRAKAEERKVVDKTGAGDVLAGVFLTLLANNYSASIALEKAVQIASVSVEQHGIDFLLTVPK